jgi:hypothetical protein
VDVPRGAFAVAEKIHLEVELAMLTLLEDDAPDLARSAVGLHDPVEGLDAAVGAGLVVALPARDVAPLFGV